MTDEPKNPQQIIDDATKALGQSPPSGIPTPIPIATPPLMQTTPVEPQPTVNPPLAEPAAIPLPPPPPILPLPPTPQKPEPLVIPPKDQQQEPPQTIVKPPKKKGGKGLLIGMLLFFILTLPVAIYYGTQQITEFRSRAAGRCEQARTSGLCIDIECNTYTNATSCTSGTGTCCRWVIVSTPTPTTRPAATNTPTRQPTTGGLPACPNTDCQIDSTIPEAIHCTGYGYASTYCCPPAKPLFNPTTRLCTTIPFLKCCAKYNTTYAHTTCLGASESGCRANPNYCIPWSSPTCPAEITVTSTPGGGGGGNTPTPGGGGACTNRTRDGTWHGCDYIHNSGGTGPTASGCGNNPNDYNMNNCGGQPCCQFTFKCGVYCLAASCGAAACYNDPTNTPGPGATNTPQPTNTPGPTATETPGPTATPTIGNTSAPGTCDASCDTDSNCESGLSCYSVTGVKRCRKAACPDRSNCECPLAAEPTATTRYYQPGQPTATTIIERVIAEAPIATATQRPTPKVPVSGIIDVKAIIITVGSILLLVLGLIL